MEFDIRREELALAREQTQRQFEASLQQNQMMTTMMVSFSIFSCLSQSVHCTDPLISNSRFLTIAGLGMILGMMGMIGTVGMIGTIGIEFPESQFLL